jgi:hypothetical protein
MVFTPAHLPVESNEKTTRIQLIGAISLQRIDQGLVRKIGFARRR